MKNKIELWPAIDIINNSPVRLLKGDYNKKTDYNINFKNVVKNFNQFAHGIHVVDLDGAKAKKIKSIESIKEILKYSNVKIEVGGGIREIKDIEILINLGVDRVIIGSKAIENIDFLKNALDIYQEKIVVAIDTKDGLVTKNAWQEKTKIKTIDFIENIKKEGVKKIMYTNIDTDGTLQGPPIKEIQTISSIFSDMDFYASGGISSIKDIKEVSKTQAKGVIFGKAYYEKKITLEDLVKYEISNNS